MRRSLALIPAVLLVLSLAPSAQAEDVPASTSKPCHVSDGSTLGTSASVTWDAANDGTSLKYLRSATVTNQCNRLYTLFEIVQRISDGTPTRPHNTAVRTTFLVAAGANRTLNKQALMHLGLWQLPFNTWFIHVMQHTGACGGSGYFVVRADGKVVQAPPCN